VVDVGGDDGAAGGDLVAHEFGGHQIGHHGAHRVAVAGIGLAAALILADRDEFHLGRDDAGAGIGKLGDRAVAGGAQRIAGDGERRGQARALDEPVIGRGDGAALVDLDIAARLQPAAADLGQAQRDVDRRVGVGIGARAVVDAQRRLAAGDDDLAQRHAQLMQGAGGIDLARGGQRAGGDLRDGTVHRCLLLRKDPRETGSRKGPVGPAQLRMGPLARRSGGSDPARPSVFLRQHQLGQVQRVASPGFPPLSLSVPLAGLP
jgi:hypothetical protein